MLFVYNILIRMVSFFVYLFKRNSIKSDPLWQGRFAQIDKHTSTDIWIHAASVGEVKVIGHLIHYLKTEKPNIKIHITTMTRSGYNSVLDSYVSENLSVTLFPFDTANLVSKTFDSIEPDILVIAETEIWPNLILEADKRNIPIVLINGRMSAKAFTKYKLFRQSFNLLLSTYNRIFVKSEDDSKRYAYFTNEKLIHLAGDMKFDAPLIERTTDKVHGIRMACGIEPESFILMAGSTRPGEEELLADMFLKIFKEHKTFNLIIAPRHIERVNEIKNMLLKKNIQFKLYGSTSKHESVILIDKVGLLQNLYLTADLAFVGGTLVEIGGHNLLEPVWAGVPVLFGPSTFNVSESAAYIKKHNYGAQVENIKSLHEKTLLAMQNNLKFAIKKTDDLKHSATRQIGNHILEMIQDV